MGFEDIKGNEAVGQYLCRTLEADTLQPVLLFTGPEGIGKSLFAIRLAILLLYPQGIEPSVRKRIEEGNHPDVYIYRPESKTGMHSIASIRSMIEQVFLAPFETKKKVFILYDAHRMPPTSANALLKTLEEPAEDTTIILLTSRPDLMLPTILSRCLKIPFTRLSDEDVTDLVEKQWDKSPFIAKFIAALAQGSPGRAYELISHQDQELKRNLLIEIMSKKQMHGYPDFYEALKKLELLYDKEKTDDAFQWYKEIDILFAQILMWYRDLYLLKIGGDRSLLFFPDCLSLLEEQNLSKLPSLDRLQEILATARDALERNIKVRHCLEYVFLRLEVI